jgi:hypothetical protein
MLRFGGYHSRSCRHCRFRALPRLLEFSEDIGTSLPPLWLPTVLLRNGDIKGCLFMFVASGVSGSIGAFFVRREFLQARSHKSSSARSGTFGFFLLNNISSLLVSSELYSFTNQQQFEHSNFTHFMLGHCRVDSTTVKH